MGATKGRTGQQSNIKFSQKKYSWRGKKSIGEENGLTKKSRSFISSKLGLERTRRKKEEDYARGGDTLRYQLCTWIDKEMTQEAVLTGRKMQKKGDAEGAGGNFPGNDPGRKTKETPPQPAKGREGKTANEGYHRCRSTSSRQEKRKRVWNDTQNS